MEKLKSGIYYITLYEGNSWFALISLDPKMWSIPFTFMIDSGHYIFRFLCFGLHIVKGGRING